MTTRTELEQLVKSQMKWCKDFHYQNQVRKYQSRSRIWMFGCIGLGALCLILLFNAQGSESRGFRLGSQICAIKAFK